MTTTPPYADLLDLIDDRAAALRAAARAAPGLDARVPSCPDWSVADLVAHLGEVHRSWATVVTAGPADQPPSDEQAGDLTPHGDLLDWSQESTALLLAALRATDPGRGCWTWWQASGVPATAGAVARHQVQEAAVHAYDAQLAAGDPQPLPAAAAVDGVAEFLTVVLGASGAWPHRPAVVTLSAVEGPAWQVELTPSGVRVQEGGRDGTLATVHGTASDLVLVLNRRVGLDRVSVDGDSGVVGELLAWPDLS
jgi:uncharacterized protein (TIGR03083 family)